MIAFDAEIYPTEVLIKNAENGLEQNSVVLLNQVRSIDSQRLIKHLGSLDREVMEKIDRALEVSLGLAGTK